MNEKDFIAKRIGHRWLSRRNLIRGAAGAVVGVGFFRRKPAYADDKDQQHGQTEQVGCGLVNPIPGGVIPFKPFGVVVHHNPLNPLIPLANINDPSQITDFDGVVGLTHIRGGGTGTDTSTGAMTPLAYQADMGFAQGKFIGADGHMHQGTLAFV
jgi:hypothetical protein